MFRHVLTRGRWADRGPSGNNACLFTYQPPLTSPIPLSFPWCLHSASERNYLLRERFSRHPEQHPGASSPKGRMSAPATHRRGFFFCWCRDRSIFWGDNLCYEHSLIVSYAFTASANRKNVFSYGSVTVCVLPPTGAKDGHGSVGFPELPPPPVPAEARFKPDRPLLRICRNLSTSVSHIASSPIKSIAYS